MALVALNGLLAGSELAIVSIRKTRVDELLRQGRSGAPAVARLRSDPERFLATVQIGITVVGSAAGAFGGASIARDLEPVLRPALGNLAPEVAFALVVGAVSYFSLVLGELVPKSLALRAGESYALIVSRPLLVLSRLSGPLVWVLTASSNAVLRLFGDRTNFIESRVSPGEIQQLVDEATNAGTVHPAAGEVVARALELGDVTAAHVMIPRGDVVGISARADAGAIRRIILENGKSRFVVYEGTIDEIVGYVTLRDLVSVLMEDTLLVLDDAIRAPLVVPRAMLCADLLAEMRRTQIQLALVIDEGGSVIGIATMEDVLGELVGDVGGEHGEPRRTDVLRRPDGSFEIDAAASLREVRRALDRDLPGGDEALTVAGLVLELAGRIPRPGEEIELPDGSRIEVLEASTHRIKRVRLRPRR